MPQALGLFWLQFRVLTWKNWVVISKTPFLSILRCLLLPIAYGVFLSYAQFMLHRLNNYGTGSTAPIPSLSTQFDGTKTLYLADATTRTSPNTPSPSQIMMRALSDFTDRQSAAVQMANPLDIPELCPQNFDGYSRCYAAVAFTDMDLDGPTPQGVNYTIFADAGLNHIDVERHTSDVVQRILPLQWAIDKAIIELQTNTIYQLTPLEWGYSNQTNAQQDTAIRLSYARGIRAIIALALFLAFASITYQIAGSVANERALLITEHMRAMGLYDSARILSWHISISLTYFPGWLIVGILWKIRIFTETSGALIVFLHILLGLVLASWSLAVAIPFGGSPQLAGAVATFLSVILAIFGMVINTSSTFIMSFVSLLFPPAFYIFALKAICGYENHQLPTNSLIGDPDSGIELAPLLTVAIFDIILWPFLAVALERYMYGVNTLYKSTEVQSYPAEPMPANTAISVRNLSKVYTPSFWSRRGDVTAVYNLSLDIPKTGIFVLLGSNGAGKSTTMAIMAGLSSMTAGTVTFDGGYERPPRGVLGIVPQKNVLFPDLTCMETLQVWRAIKWSTNQYETDADLETLLKDCDLEKKIHSNADTLSGGQKRKLQLAIGLLGGSKVILVDECTSGVDPLSRRALWKAISRFRDDRCIVFTTHFLDEADLLADNIAILAAPGKVVAYGSPVSLKREVGEGYSVQVTFGSLSLASDEDKIYGYASSSYDLLHSIKAIAPETYVTKPSPTISIYHLKTRDCSTVGRVLYLLEEEERQQQIERYDILATTIEDVFLQVMNQEQAQIKSPCIKSHSATSSLDDLSSNTIIKPSLIMELPNGKAVNPYRQAFTIFHKRVLIARRGWMTPLLAILVAVTGATIPLTFTAGLEQRCNPVAANITAIPLFLPDAPFAMPNASENLFPRMIVSPPNLLSSLGNLTSNLTVDNVADGTAFADTVVSDRHNLELGGISLDPTDGGVTVAWEASPPGIRAPAMLNMASNVLLQRAINMSSTPSTQEQSQTSPPPIIATNYGVFAKVAMATVKYLRWIFFFGAVMAVYPAFFALYVSKERRSDVQAMQLSNGLTNPVGLWLGHLMFDTITSVIISTIIIIIFSTVSNQFHGLGLLWIVFVLYGITATLFSYCLSLMTSSALASFAIVAGYQFIMLVLYLSSYLLVLTFANVDSTQRLTTIIHFSISFLAPIDSVVRATLVSVNLFSLLCQGGADITVGTLLSIRKFGGPILYLVVHAFILLGILVWIDSGSQRPRPLRRKRQNHVHRRLLSTSSITLNDDVADLQDDSSNSALLRVTGVSKSFHGKQVTDDINLNIEKDSIFALLGPNGAGKTTTFKMIRGDVIPDFGDVIINGHSIVTNPRLARTSLGVCPQFTAVDDQLTVREHLVIYGRLKGLNRGKELDSSVEAVLEGTALTGYADRLACKLSGGNQRKLSLAIALLGNPPVILIDEFSTGVDPKMKRDMWQTLRRVAVGKAIVITTHSMEEASALATNVGILSKKMLALGTSASLASRYGTYEVQFVCRTREEIIKARNLMSHIPGSRMADDVATRFEVPISSSSGTSYCLADLFRTLSEHSDGVEYTVERGSLESVFLKVIKENNAREEERDYTTTTSKASAISFWSKF